MSTFETMKAIIKELLVTALCATLLGEAVIFATSQLDISFPLRPDQRPIFVLGIVLFSLAFRLLIRLREEPK
jgi:hypothetical protein